MVSLCTWPWPSARMFARANSRLAFRLGTRFVCSKPLPPLDCLSNLCRHRCCTDLVNSQASYPRTLVAAECLFPHNKAWGFLPRVVVLVNTPTFPLSKLVGVVQVHSKS